MILPIRQGIKFDGADRGRINFSTINLTGDFSIKCLVSTSNNINNNYGCILSNNTANNRIMVRNNIVYVGVAGNSVLTYTPPSDLYGKITEINFERISGKIYITVDNHPTFEGTTQLGTVALNTLGLTSTSSFKFRGEMFYLLIKDNGNSVLEYKFDEGDGTTVFDISGNGRNGTIIKANWIIRKPLR